MNQLYREYGKGVEFLLIYVREAHPSDGWQVGANRKEGVEYKKPTSLAERARIAGDCVKSLGIEFTCLVDGLDDQVEKVYGGWPSRAMILDKTGKIFYLSQTGPRGVDPSALRRELKRLTGAPPAATDDKAPSNDR